jgi:hypothetical protein
MEPRIILPLALFLALAALFLLVLQRASRLVARTREHERFQRAIADLDARFGRTIDPVIGGLDDIRRHQIGADALADVLAKAGDELRSEIDQTRALRGPAGLTDVPPSYARELERAERAVGLAEHGRSGLIATRGGPRELEAQTSLKRAALNLRHAREAAATVARRVAETLPPGTQRARGGSRQSRPPTPIAVSAVQAPVATSPVTGPPVAPIMPGATVDGGPDGGSDPSM